MKDRKHTLFNEMCSGWSPFLSERIKSEVGDNKSTILSATSSSNSLTANNTGESPSTVIAYQKKWKKEKKEDNMI